MIHVCTKLRPACISTEPLSELPYKKKLGAKSSRASIPKALITRGRSAGSCKDRASPQTGLVSFTGTPKTCLQKLDPEPSLPKPKSFASLCPAWPPGLDAVELLCLGGDAEHQPTLRQWASSYRICCIAGTKKLGCSGRRLEKFSVCCLLLLNNINAAAEYDLPEPPSGRSHR